MKDIMQLSPHVSHKIWGGELLSKLKGVALKAGQDPVGETWEVSAHSDGASKSSEGLLSKIYNLSDIPYLVKLIETSDNLSVQVHPNDQYAEKFENQKGKSECWIILDALPGEGIYLGMKDSITKEKFQKALANKEDVSELITFYPVKRGDFFYVPAGTAHAIGKGVFLAEVQQCSDVTYRVWDWNRLDKEGKSRELHVDKALDVIRFDEEFNFPVNFKIQNNVLDHSKIKLLELSDFELTSYKIEDEELDLSFSARFSSILVIEGEIELTRGSEKIKLENYQAALFPLGENNKIHISGQGNFLFVR